MSLPAPGQLWSKLRKDGSEHASYLTLSCAELNEHGHYQVLALRLGEDRAQWHNANGFLNAKSWRREA